MTTAPIDIQDGFAIVHVLGNSQTVLESGYSTLKDAYKRSVAIAATPEVKASTVHIWLIESKLPTVEWTLTNAYNQLQNPPEEIPEQQEAEEEDHPQMPGTSLCPWKVGEAFTLVEGGNPIVPVLDRLDTPVCYLSEKNEARDIDAIIISKAPDIMFSAAEMAMAIEQKDPMSRSEAENKFIYDITQFLSPEPYAVNKDELSDDLRTAFLDFMDASEELYDNVRIWLRHGQTPTPEMIQEMGAAMRKTMEIHQDMRTLT